MLHRWSFQQKKQTKDQELSIEFYPQGSLPSYLFFWLLQTSWQPELSKHLCYTGGILIWGLVQQKTSKMEMELTICSFAASSGYKEWVTETSSLARDRTIRGSLTCKCAAKGAEKREKILKTWPKVLSTHSLTHSCRFLPEPLVPQELSNNNKSEHWILLKKHEEPGKLYKFKNELSQFRLIFF